MSHVIYAVIAQETPGFWNIVGIWSPPTGFVACVSSNLNLVIDHMWPLVSEESKKKHGAKIAKFVEVEDVKITHNKEH